MTKENAHDLGDDTPVTESEAFADLVKWGRTRCAWQQDALATLIRNGELTDSDIDDLEQSCLDPGQSKGLLKGGTKTVFEGNSAPISLTAIKDPKGINALADDQALIFGESGLTVVYGDNGAGKSGYVRILKNACHTRDGNTEILRDIEDTKTTAQSALIRYRRGTDEVDFSWTPSSTENEDLPSVSIFDSRSANIHVEKTNAVAYIPRPMQVLESLANCCDEIKSRLTSKASELRRQSPASIRQPNLSAETAAGSFVHNLSEKSTKSQLQVLTKFDDDDRNRLQALNISLGQSDKTLVATLRGQKARLEAGISAATRLITSSTSKEFDRRAELLAAESSANEAADAASTRLFAKSELPGIGKGAWMKLWEAARQYSDSIAYPKSKFPTLESDDEHCVLCHQPLTETVLTRWSTFEEHVKGATRIAADAAKNDVSYWRTEIESARMALAQIRSLSLLVNEELGDSDLAERVRRACVLAAWRHRQLLRVSPESAYKPELPHADLEALSQQIETRIDELTLEEGSSEKEALKKELQDLIDREKLAQIKDDVELEIERLVEIDEIVRAQKDTAKNAITLKNKDLTDKIVTNALRGRFAREVEKLKLTAAPVELRKVKDRNAVSYFQVGLIESPNDPVGEIFSEGEHRCVALAAFLAELVTSKDYSAIVFDDPMSSLDHVHRKSVAARLAQEAQYRQVIVFTHDLTFLYELRREAGNLDIPVHYQTVRTKSGCPGHVAGELPTKAKSALQLTRALRQELKAVKGQYEQWKEARRVLFAKGFIEQLREAWEQGIADYIYPVLGRFENAVKGSSLYKLEVLTAQDVEIVTEARGRLSEGLHASAQTINPSEVTHEQLRNEIQALEDWLNDIFSRQKNAMKPANAYAQPQ